MGSSTSLLGSHLQRIAEPLRNGSVAVTIAETETLLAAWPQEQTKQKLQAVKDDYRQLLSDWQDHEDEADCKERYQSLLQRLYVLYANLSVFDRISTAPHLSAVRTAARESHVKLSLGKIRQELESFVADVALLSLEQPHVRAQKSQSLYEAHQQYMGRLFGFLLTSNAWPESVGRQMEELLLSPAVDTTDQQLLVSAVTLSLLNQFDGVKFQTLVHTYRQATDEAVRQRALVGWVLGMDEQWNAVCPGQCDSIRQLLQSEAVCRELAELQMQMVYCMGAERDATEIQQEIMPDIINKKPLHIKPQLFEDDELDIQELVHPEEYEERMQRMEDSFLRMVDMQQQGSDIFFGGFSQMKRFDFFREPANWFVPFFMDHPQLRPFRESCAKHPFLQEILINGEFCNSDKYSIALGCNQFLNVMPADVVRAMDEGGAAVMQMEHQATPTPERLRRSYLMDLYRFFRIYAYRSEYRNPFLVTDSNEMGGCLFLTGRVFQDSGVEAMKDEVVQLLFRRKMAAAARRLLDSYADSHRGLAYYLWTGRYEEALRCDPDNERAERGLARQLFGQGEYQQAEAHYDRLMERFPDKMGYPLNKAVCMLYQKRYEESLKLLYRLNYEHPEHTGVMRILAWTLVCDRREQQAETYYERLEQMGEMTADDHQNRGYCLWLQGKRTAAADSFRQHLALTDRKTYDADYFDRQMLDERDISATERQLMLDLVFSPLSSQHPPLYD